MILTDLGKAMGSEGAGVAAGAVEEAGAQAILQGNEFYRLGQFSESFDKYAMVIDQGLMSAGVYYNLGNAAFRLGDPGLALAGFRVAQDLAPRDSEIAANIVFTQSGLGVPSRDGLASWHDYVLWTRYLSGQEYLVGLSIVLSAFFVSLSVEAVLRNSAARLAAALRTASLLLGLFALIIGSCFLANWDRTAPRARGIVIAPKISLRSEAAAESLELFSLPRGTEFRVLEEIPAVHPDQLSYIPLAGEARMPVPGRWIRVRYNNETKGWLKSDEVIIF
jgi:tetratricopeptide (TPR) repeat protein